MAVLEEIRAAGADGQSDLGTLRRKCKLLASRLGSRPQEELALVGVEWISGESSGDGLWRLAVGDRGIGAFWIPAPKHPPKCPLSGFGLLIRCWKRRVIVGRPSATLAARITHVADPE